MLPSSSGAVTWFASQVAPYPEISQYIFAPLFLACSYSSRISIPAPSPITNPPLSASNGIEALAGSVAVLNAFMAENPPIPNGVMLASEPPHTHISLYPSLICLNPSPMALVALAQAVTTLVHMP